MREKRLYKHFRANMASDEPSNQSKPSGNQPSASTPAISDSVKLAIGEAIAAIETERAKKVDRRIAIFSGIAGTGLFAIIVGFSLFLRDAAESTARKEVQAEVARSDLIRNQTTALEAIINARSKLEGSQHLVAFNLKQSEDFLERAKTVLLDIEKQKKALDQLPDVALAVAKFTEVSGQVESAIRNSPELINLISQRVALPKGIVLAFNTPAATRCPEGWSIVQALTGRIIIGAGVSRDPKISSYQSFKDAGDRAIGGSQTLNLTVEQLPKHSHRFGMQTITDLFRQNNQYPGIVDVGGQFKQGAPGVRSARTDDEGLGADIDIRPPFVPLYYCTNE
jgi:hypothetical protein